MRRLLTWIVLLTAAAVVVAFAIANREQVRVSLAPLPFESALPLYGVAMAAALIGLTIGAAGAWLKVRTWRRLVREQRLKAERLEAELRVLRESVPPPAGSTVAPAAPDTDV